MRARLVLLVSCLLLPCTVSSAQDDKAALKAFRPAAKQVAADASKGLAAALADGKAALADFDAAVAQGDFDVEPTIALGTDLDLFMRAVGEEVEQARAALEDAVVDALDAAGGGFAGVLPPGLLPGDGGVLDGTRALVEKRAALAVGKLAKRLAVSRQKLFKREGETMLFTLVPPRMAQHATSDVTSGGIATPPRIDVLVSVGGLLLVAGSASSDFGTLTLSVTTVDGALPALSEESGGTDPGVDRFGVVIANELTGQPFEPGLYAVVVASPFNGYDGMVFAVR